MQRLPELEHTIWFNHGLAKGLDVADPERAFAAIRREPEFIEACGDRQICVIPGLLEGGLIDQHDLSFEGAISADGPLNLFQRLRVKRWVEQVGLTIDEVL